MHKVFCLSTMALAAAGQSPGATIPAADTSASAVQAAVNQAADGDTVLVPAGSSTWSTTVTVNKGIKIRGAGIGQTVITTSGGVLLMANPGGKYFQLGGFTFNDVGSPEHWNGMIGISGSTFRVCSNRFYIYYNGVKTWTENSFGVIDHNYFLQNPAASAQANGVRMDGSGDGSGLWSGGPHYGSTNYVYMEDNIFDYANQGNGAFDAYTGARFVFRHNWVTNTCANTHGTDSSGTRSPHSFELYNNFFTANNLSDRLSWFFEFRGGTGLIFSNTCVTSKRMSSSVVLRCYRVFKGDQYVFGCVTGSNPKDGNTDGGGYPALDQPGRTGPTTFTGSHSTQVQEPVYIWANKFNGSTMGGAAGNYASICGGDSEAQLIQTGRDYINSAKPGYTPLVYPHPLVSGAAVIASQSAPPSAPTQLRVVSLP